MGPNAVVERAWEALGPVGVFLPGPILSSPVPAALLRDSARQLEGVGYRAAWGNEVVFDKDAFVHLSLLLSSTDRVVFGTSIANIWARGPQVMQLAASGLAEAYPGRFVLGVGVGYPIQAESVGREWGSPLAMMRAYIEQMDAPPLMRHVPEVAFPRILAARGPRMLELAGAIADGANPNSVPPEYTARARGVLGPDKLLVVGVTTVLDANHDRARDTARESVRMLGQAEAAMAVLASLGYSDDEVSSGADRVVDALVAYGGPEAIAARVREHLAAGADHVMIMVQGSDFSAGIDQLVELAPALTVIHAPTTANN